MAFENGVSWRPVDPHLRGRHTTFGSALDAAFADLVTEHPPFYDSLVDEWKRLFPDLPAKPDHWEGGTLWLGVRNAPTLYAMQAKLPRVKKTLAELPGAPKRLQVRVRIVTPSAGRTRLPVRRSS